jgi:protein-disulfide isomerase
MWKALIVLLVAAGCQRSQPAAGRAGAATMDPKAVLARVDGVAITEGDLAPMIKGELIRTENEYLEKVYSTRAGALDQAIAKKLLEKKATSEKLTADELLKRDVFDKIPEPNDESLHALYDRAVAAGEQLPPFEAVKGEIRNFVREQAAQRAVQEYYEGLREGAKVENLLPPLLLPRQDVAAVGQSKGAQGAPITIVEFSDYECPFCGRAEPTIKRILEEYKGKVRLVYRDFPLDGHHAAQKASEAALCASDQGKYWEMHDLLFTNQEALAVPELKQYAGQLGLDQTKFDGCLDSGAKAKEIEESKKAGSEAGVSATPAFFINGRPISGAQPFEAFQKLIDLELKGS